jgi:protein-disulfide isomerase
MKTLLAAAAATWLVALAPGAAAAAQPTGPCAALDAAARARAAQIMAAVNPHECCDETLAACAAKAAPSRLVKRLAADVCRRVAKGEGVAGIQRELSLRAESMLGTGKPATIDTTAAAWAGDPAAKVAVVGYVCTRCPYCAMSAPKLADLVTAGALKGKAKLALRPFPLRSHEGSKEGALALTAAQALGKFWPYALHLFGHFDAFSLTQLVPWAEQVGLDRGAFAAKMADPALLAAVVASVKEGKRNGVDGTPTYFINGKRYTADLAHASLLDALEEELERVDGTLCNP